MVDLTDAERNLLSHVRNYYGSMWPDIEKTERAKLFSATESESEKLSRAIYDSLTAISFTQILWESGYKTDIQYYRHNEKIVKKLTRSLCEKGFLERVQRTSMDD